MAEILAPYAVDVWCHIACDRNRIGRILVAERNGFHPLFHCDHWRNHAYSGADVIGVFIQWVGA